MSTLNPPSTSQPATKDQLRQFVLENLAQPKGVGSFTDDEPLMERGIIDSLDIFRLVAFLEDELGIRVQDEEINPDTLRSLNTIEELVSRKRTKK
jgi:acyl carrier protein